MSYQGGPHQQYPPPPTYNQATGYATNPPPPSNYQPPPPNYQSPTAVHHGQQPKPVPVVPRTVGAMESQSDTPFAGSSFSDKAIRMAFIRKVYLILTCQLLVTVGFIAFFLFHESTRNWVRTNSWFYFISYGIFLVLYIVLVCCPKVRRKWPVNFICLGLFTLAFSYMTATISSYHNIDAVLIAAGITTVVCVAISIFACQTKIDFTKCGGLLFALLLVLILFGLGCMIAYFVYPVDRRTHGILQCVYGSLGALVFCLFLAYDTQMLIGGKTHELSEEEHIFAALQLYLDVVYIFLFILTIMNGASNT